MLRYTDLANSLPSTVPFVGPETQERARGQDFKARIGANESVFGPSPKAVEAMSHAASEVWRYGDPENHDLKHALADHHNVRPDNIVIGEGIDGLLGLLVRLFVGQDVPVVTSLGAYPTFNYHVAGFGGKLETVPYIDDREDPESLLEAVKHHEAPLFYFANPDNPMGSHHDAQVVQALINLTPDDTVLCLDEAYCEFAPSGTVPELDTSKPNVVRMRTFSKAYGMAGARIGYAIAHQDLAAAFNKVRNHFGVNRIGLEGALAALSDHEWLQSVLNSVGVANARISELARENGLLPLPTATNFVTIDCGQDEDYAKALVAELGRRDIFVRMPFVAPQSRCIRISAGTVEDLNFLQSVLPLALNSVQSNRQ